MSGGKKQPCSPKPFRCAIYARKSTSKGLEKEFNSLDAQREACEAYILSQRFAGWICLPDYYDDGGFSGANTERPALIRLLGDVKAGKVDCIVTYKVDRLSRSLLDFARIIGVLDANNTTFVSVTQNFNTNDSLGRLTLNLLLSFSQFEREMISERTRDKMSATRKKGKWVGGIPPLGYDIALGGGRLVINKMEAEIVKGIFSIYAETESLRDTLRIVRAYGWKSKTFVSQKGIKRGGNNFFMSSLSAILHNYTYVGKINYKGSIYDGEQEAILGEDLWERVQLTLVANKRGDFTGEKSGANAPLRGIVFCGNCKKSMSQLLYGSRNGIKQRYYVCSTVHMKGRNCCPNRSVKAEEMESFIMNRLHEVASDKQLVENSMLSAIPRYGDTTLVQRRLAISSMIERVECNSICETLTIEFKKDAVKGEFGKALSLTFKTAFSYRKTTSTKEKTGRLPRVTRLMALAIKLGEMIRKREISNMTEICKVGNISRARLTQILNLAFLAPDIQEELLFHPLILKGRDPVTERNLRVLINEVDWERQRKMWKELTR